ncbi:hypothetical protein LCGC14_2773060, partial [marine sediment metagenome]
CDRAGNVTAHLDRVLDQSPVDPASAALAWELAMGVVRRRGTLDALIDAFRQRAGRSPVGRIREILRMGAYQLLFLDRVPDFAAVNEAVAMVPVRGGRKMRGFVNALLRQMARHVSEVQDGSPPPATDVLPLSGRRFRRFDRPVFPDPAGDPRGYLAAAMSLPDELAGKWLSDFGSLSAARAPAFHANARAPLILRVNSLIASVEQVTSRLGEQGIEAAPHANGLSVVLAHGAGLTGLDVFAEGLLQPQDAAATAVIARAPVAPGMRVLDLCAAPGTKTTHLAERMADRGEIVAVDVSAEKLSRIEDNCRRMKISIVRTLLAEKVTTLDPESFDLVLADVPCSNTGVLARRPEARWRFTMERMGQLVRDQRQLLMLAASFVRPGGACVYSTCSLEKQENEQAVRHLLSRRGDFSVAV